jgi:transcription antitermination protein NusB
VPSRRKTREFALQVLFAADARNQDPIDTLEFLQAHFTADEDQELKMHRVVEDFARVLVAVVSREGLIIDDLISRISQNWKLSRINRVDRNILRMAIAEMIGFPETPGAVILNEAIEIGKKYGAENSAAFINGILDRIQTLEKRPGTAVELRDMIVSLDQSASIN